MKKHYFYSLFCGVAAVAMCSCSEKVSGRWEGECHNDTFGGQGSLSIILKESNGNIHGSLVIGGEELGGSGEISGVISGSNISFTSPGGSQEFSNIVWMGTIQGKSIIGTYRVEPTAYAASYGIPVQIGRFAVTKK